MKGGLTSRTVVASTILAVTVGASFVFSLVAISAERDWERQVTGSLEELALVNELERLVIDLETGVRGFLITHEERFLEPWEEARAAFPGRAEELVGLTDDPVQDPLARQITADVESYIEDYAVPLLEAARRNDPAASGVAATDGGKGARRRDSCPVRSLPRRRGGPARSAPRPRQRRCSAGDPRRDGRPRWVAAADRPLCRLHRQGDRDADTSRCRHGRPPRQRRPLHAIAGDRHRRDRFARPLVQRHGPLARGESRRSHPAAGGAGCAPAGRHARRPRGGPGRDLRRGRRGGRRGDQRRCRRRGSFRDRRCRDQSSSCGAGCRGGAGRDALGTGRCPGDVGGAADRPRCPRGRDSSTVRRARSPTSCAGWVSARWWPARSSSRVTCGGRWSPGRRARSCRRTPRSGWRASPSSSPRPSPTRRAVPSSPPPGPASWPRPTTPAGASNAISTTARNSVWWRSASS